jgi:ABC-type enterochelin transport system substrate-binding protein
MVVVAMVVRLLVALNMGSSILHEIIDKNRPGALLVIIRQIVVHGRRKIQQQVPRVLWHKQRYSFSV